MQLRPDRDEWHFDGCDWLSRMADCTRRRVGAIIVGPDKRFWGMGYNGSYPGGPSCLAGDCPRGRHYRQPCQNPQHFHSNAGRFACIDFDTCACGNDWPCPDAVTPSSSYDTGPGACIATHAEANAVADALRRGGGQLDGCVLYVNAEPCEGCIRHIRNTTRIEAILWRTGTSRGTVALP